MTYPIPDLIVIMPDPSISIAYYNLNKSKTQAVHHDESQNEIVKWDSETRQLTYAKRTTYTQKKLAMIQICLDNGLPLPIGLESDSDKTAFKKLRSLLTKQPNKGDSIHG
jgi:hypothetical protein